jgi:hypothetical protein
MDNASKIVPKVAGVLIDLDLPWIDFVATAAAVSCTKWAPDAVEYFSDLLDSR